MRGRRAELNTIEGRINNFLSRAYNRAGCWIWDSYLNKGGYGYHKYEKKTWLAHRLSYWLFNGTFDLALDVCHRCDTPACVNPNHLFLGTHQDNIDDMMRKGRHALICGLDNKKTKLTIEQVRLIRELYAKGGTSLTKLAQQFNVVHSTIRSLLIGKTWKAI